MGSWDTRLVQIITAKQPKSACFQIRNEGNATLNFKGGKRRSILRAFYFWPVGNCWP